MSLIHSNAYKILTDYNPVITREKLKSNEVFLTNILYCHSHVLLYIITQFWHIKTGKLIHQYFTQPNSLSKKYCAPAKSRCKSGLKDHR